MFLNCLMVQKLIFPYIPYTVKCNFNCNIQNSLFNIPSSITFQISQNLIFPYISYTVKCNFNNNFKVQKSISNFTKPYISLYSLYGLNPCLFSLISYWFKNFHNLYVLKTFKSALNFNNTTLQLLNSKKNFSLYKTLNQRVKKKSKNKGEKSLPMWI
jgi:hypothetical protein